MKTNHVYEEQMVDFIEGTLSIEEKSKVSEHIKECQQCHELYLEWKGLLDQHMPISEFDRRKVWHGIQKDLIEDQSRRQSYKRRLLYCAWCISCLFFLWLGYALGDQSHSQYAANIESIQDEHLEAFMNRPVEHYDMVSSDGGESQGVAWYNPYNKQMILYLNDPTHVNNRLHEIQIQTENRIIPIQPNHFNDGKVQFYVRDQDLEDLMQLVVIPDKDGPFTQTYYFQMNP